MPLCNSQVFYVLVNWGKISYEFGKILYHFHVLCDQLTSQWGLDLGVRLKVKLHILFQKVLRLVRIKSYTFIWDQQLFKWLGTFFDESFYFSSHTAKVFKFSKHFFLKNNNKRLQDCALLFSIIFFLINFDI